MRHVGKRHTVAATRVETAQAVLPGHTNSMGTLFGGVVMQWIDVAAAIAASRHAGGPVVTASMDRLHFLRPVHVQQFVIVHINHGHGPLTSAPLWPVPGTAQAPLRPPPCASPPPATPASIAPSPPSRPSTSKTCSPRSTTTRPGPPRSWGSTGRPSGRSWAAPRARPRPTPGATERRRAPDGSMRPSRSRGRRPPFGDPESPASPAALPGCRGRRRSSSPRARS